MKNTVLVLRDEFKDYSKQLAKLNVYGSDIDYLEGFTKITITEEVFEKLGRKNFPRKATSTEVKETTARQYLCYLTSIGFFGDRVEKSYTVAGYIPTKLSCTSPNKEKKITRSFKIERKER